ncbi:hypothetical protein NQ318_008567 [Aromia moschata]|uniref:Uncharacterized protein n=1 Tax=Aromia moschata TaxID=1265417 RepID=A0AAV8YUI9_9CUCU|nr:hypothetical protein NQ318_008567 [Aromia moschata]
MSEVKPISNEDVMSKISLSQCVAEASRRFFTRRFDSVTFTLPLNRSQGRLAATFTDTTLEALALSGNKPLLIKNLNDRKNFRLGRSSKSHSYIIQIKGSGEFDSSMEQLKSFPSWNPHARFLVVSPTVFEHPQSVAAEITRSLWNHKVINGVVLLANPEDTDNYTVYSWYPYDGNSCGDKYQNTLRINYCSFGRIQTNRSWFEEKLPKQMNNCTIKVSFIDWPPFVLTSGVVSPASNYFINQGIEVNLVNMVAANLNLYVSYQHSESWGDVEMNGSATGALQVLRNHSIDIAIGGYSTTYSRSVYFDMSRPHMQEAIVWCVPRVPSLAGFTNMINIITAKVWISLVFTYLLISFLIWYLGSLDRNESSSYSNLSSILMNNFAALIGFASRHLPRTLKTRYCMALLIWLGIYITILYNTYLTSIIAKPKYTEKYTTMKDIYKYKLNTYFMPNFKRYFEGDDDNRIINGVPIKVIKERWRNCHNVRYCLGRVANSKDSAVCTSKLFTDYMLSSNENNRRLLYCVNTNIVAFPMAIIMRKGFPLFDLFYNKINRISEAGFIVKWRKDILTRHRRNQSVVSDFDKISIKFNNLCPIFYMLLTGCAISFVVFVLEIVIYKMKAKEMVTMPDK